MAGFDTQPQLRQHQRICLPGSTLLEQCDRDYTEGDIQCDQCDERFKTMRQLYGHKRVHGKRARAEAARLFAAQREALEINQAGSDDSEVYVESTAYQCDVCHRNFGGAKALYNHAITHKEKRFECMMCDKEFYYHGELRKHVDKCHGVLMAKRQVPSDQNVDDSYLASDDILEYVDADVLEILPEGTVPDDDDDDAETTGIVEVAYQCDLCPKIFETQEQLYIHAVEHSYHACKECDLTFRRPSELSQHVKLHHNYDDSPTIVTVQDNCNEYGMYQCSQCPKLFPNKKKLYSHNVTHRTPRYSCKLCGTRFHYPAHLKLHLRRHKYGPQVTRNPITRRKPEQSPQDSLTDYCFSCEQCPKMFSSSKKLYTHRVTHRVKRYSCEICAASYYYPAHLRMHMRHHKVRMSRKDIEYEDVIEVYNSESEIDSAKSSGKRKKSTNYSILTKRKHGPTQFEQYLPSPFKCSECGKGFLTKKSLYCHETIHEEKKYSCDLCTRKFYRAQEVVTHKTIEHYGKRQKIKYPCPHCQHPVPKVFMERHIATHLKPKLFHCTDCDEYFHSQDNLKFHQTTEHDEKFLFQCERCSVTFHSLSSLCVHKRLKHKRGTGKKKYICNVCRRGFVSESMLTRHSEFHEESSFMCTVCDTGFKTVYDLLLHEASHQTPSDALQSVAQTPDVEAVAVVVMKPEPDVRKVDKYNCHVCTKKFNSYKQLTDHRVIHKEHRFTCDSCKTTFYYESELKKHIRVHHMPGLRKKYPCDYCTKMFLNPSTLTKHISVSHFDNRYPCFVCQTSFTSLKRLRSHKVAEHGVPERSSSGKVKKCEECGKLFVDKIFLQQHTRLHLEFQFLCNICTNGFHTQEKLRAHQELHNSLPIKLEPGETLPQVKASSAILTESDIQA